MNRVYTEVNCLLRKMKRLAKINDPRREKGNKSKLINII